MFGFEANPKDKDKDKDKKGVKINTKRTGSANSMVGASTAPGSGLKEHTATSVRSYISRCCFKSVFVFIVTLVSCNFSPKFCFFINLRHFFVPVLFLNGKVVCFFKYFDQLVRRFDR